LKNGIYGRKLLADWLHYSADVKKHSSSSSSSSSSTSSNLNIPTLSTPHVEKLSKQQDLLVEHHLLTKYAIEILTPSDGYGSPQVGRVI
jgi:hypothetical protein